MRTTTIFTALLGAALAIPTAAQCPGGGYNRGGGGPGSIGAPVVPPIPSYAPGDVVAPRPSGPSGPSTPSLPGSPRPSGPNTPTPGSGPSTPGPRGVATPAAGPTTPRGTVMQFCREDETLHRIEIGWDFPHVPAVEQPLSWPEAVAALADGDSRPILVRRQPHELEAHQADRIAALLADEEVRILSRWFRCVDLPDTTRNPAHPFSGLYEPGAAPLLFVVDPDASDAIGFSGLEPQSQIVRRLYDALERNYEGDLDRSVKGIRKLLESYDRLHARDRELRVMRDDAVVEGGERSEAVHQIDRKLEKVAADLDATHERERALSTLRPRATVSAADGGR